MRGLQPISFLKRCNLDTHHWVTMVIQAAERFSCRHELIGLPGFFRCAKCPFQVSELPLSRTSGATIVTATFSGGEDAGDKFSKSA